MKNNWEKVKLSTIAKITMGQSPKSSYYNSVGEGMPFLQGNRTFGFLYPTFDTWTTMITKIAKTRDVIMSVRAPVGELNITPTDICLGRGVCSIRMNDNNQTFLYYLMKYMKPIIVNKESGTVFGSINSNDINNLEVCIPKSKETQKKIAKVLSAFDDKIELNNKINENLEQQAQAIFNKKIINNKSISWKQDNLLGIANYLNGLAMQNFYPKDKKNSLPVLKIRELRQGFCDINSDLCDNTIKSDYIIENGDVVFSWSGTLLLDIWCGGKCGLNQHLFKVFSNKYDKWFIFFWTKYYLNKFISIAADKATTMGHIKREDLEKSKVIIPPKEIYNKISLLMDPIFKDIINNRIENNKLVQLRDTLLPKLMNGEIDVDKIKI